MDKKYYWFDVRWRYIEYKLEYKFKITSNPNTHFAEWAQRALTCKDEHKFIAFSIR